MKKENLSPHHPSYKEVDVILTSWKKAKLRYVTNTLTDYTANGSFKSLADNVKYLDEGYARLIRLTDLRKNLEVDNPIYVSEEGYNFLKKSALYGEEFLIATVGAHAGFIAPMPKVSFPATLGPNMMLAKFDQSKVNNRFMYYAASSFYIQEQLALKAHSSSAQPKLNKEDFRSIVFIYPEISTQVRIVEYLDQKTSEIDTLIEDKEKIIALLEEKRQAIITEAVTKGLDPDVKMKDSGVKWIGEIPEHWEMRKAKYIFKQINEKNHPEEKLLSVLKGKGLLLRSELEFKAVMAFKGLENFKLVREGDFVIHLRSFQSGFEMSSLQGIVSPAYTVFRASIELDNNYFKYVFYSQYFIDYIGSTTQSLRDGKPIAYGDFSSSYLMFPPEKEQKEISDYLASLCKEMDKAKELIQKQLLKLKEYRQALIYEAVTGKIDVQEMLKETEQEEVSSS